MNQSILIKTNFLTKEFDGKWVLKRCKICDILGSSHVFIYSTQMLLFDKLINGGDLYERKQVV